MFEGGEMSKYHTTEIVCPACKKPYNIQIWDSVNAQINPEKKEEILSNTFYKTICPHCNEETDCVYDFLYHDMNKKYMISMLQGYPQDMLKEITKSGYSLRKVDGINQLIEKIRIFDAGLNYIVVEIMKKIVVQINKLNTDLLFCEIDKGNFVFLMLKEEKAILAPSQVYDTVLKHCTKDDLKEYPKFMAVNQSYVEKLIE